MNLTVREKKFTLFTMLSAFLICAEYAITRPASNALFLTLYSIKFYPWVWLATVPLNFMAVHFYNRFLPRFGPMKILSSLVIFSSLMNFLTGALHEQLPHLIFFQFAWKDLYVLFMFKQLWSMIHSTIASSRAKYLYGSIYGVGTIGSILGSFVPGLWAPLLGSERILYITSLIYALFFLTYTKAFQNSAINAPSFQEDLSQKQEKTGAFSLIQKSPLLIAILGLVVFCQASVALMEYQFNAHLEINILEKNARAAYYGKLMSFVNFLSLSLQFLGSFFLLRVLGLKKTHVLVPLLLCTSAVCSVCMPSFAMLSFSFVFLKGMEFSLFGVLREMLYVPLSVEAKYRAKAVIDVFAYRSSKAMIAFTLLALQSIAGSALLTLTKYVSVSLFFGWTVFILWFFRKNKYGPELVKSPSSSVR